MKIENCKLKIQPKVVVAMSGGVDSSVVAAILKSRGYDVSGVFMKFWTPRLAPLTRGKPLFENKCCSLEAKLDAKRVAVKLGIPLYIIDAQKEFKKKVVDYFIQGYKNGITPNPCVECNRWIKFKFLLEKMIELKADYIATGHYAKIKFVNSKPIRYSLMASKDKQKDQSYFLWQLSQKQLSKILFPIGNYTKTEVRKIAKKFKLSVFNKKDSQEICFVSGADIRGFLESRIHAERGPIITTDGKKIGEHKGLQFYTIGQRKGIEIGGIGPFYVISKDFKSNALIVGQTEHAPELFKKEMTVKNINWLNKPKRFPFKCKVKIRYGHKAMPAIVSRINANKGTNKYEYIVKFRAPQRAVTPGQSAVFYLKNEVLGGGVIEG